MPEEQADNSSSGSLEDQLEDLIGRIEVLSAQSIAGTATKLECLTTLNHGVVTMKDILS